MVRCDTGIPGPTGTSGPSFRVENCEWFDANIMTDRLKILTGITPLALLLLLAGHYDLVLALVAIGLYMLWEVSRPKKL